MSFAKFIKYWLFPVLWMILIFVFSSFPTIKGADLYWKDFAIKKSAHMFEYGILALLLFRALRQKISDKKTVKMVLIFCIFYAITDEFHQSFTPGRESTLRDVIFDTIGAFTSLYLAWKYLPKAHWKLQNLAKRLDLM